jgi:Phospholipase_D-nuclease N-terminal
MPAQQRISNSARSRPRSEYDGAVKNRRWSDLSLRARAAIIAFLALTLGFAAAAEVDLARRPESTVRGRKRVWAGVIAANWLIGPVAYILFGRRRSR